MRRGRFPKSASAKSHRRDLGHLEAYELAHLAIELEGRGLADLPATSALCLARVGKGGDLGRRLGEDQREPVLAGRAMILSKRRGAGHDVPPKPGDDLRLRGRGALVEVVGQLPGHAAARGY